MRQSEQATRDRRSSLLFRQRRYLSRVPDYARVSPRSVRFPTCEPEVVATCNHRGTSGSWRLGIAVRPAIKPPITAYNYFVRFVVEHAREFVEGFLVEVHMRLPSSDKRTIRRKYENVTRGNPLEYACVARVLRACYLIMEFAERGYVGVRVVLLSGSTSTAEQSDGWQE